MGRASNYNMRGCSCLLITVAVIMLQLAAAARGDGACSADEDQKRPWKTGSTWVVGHREVEEIVVYVRDILNTTDFMTVAGASEIELTGTSAPFGSVFTVDDPAYVSEEEAKLGVGKAQEVGRFRGTATFVSLDGHDMMLQVSLRLYNKGTVSLLGVFSYTDRSLPFPVVGGTGAFLLASGSATFTPIDEIPGDDQILRLALHLYLPISPSSCELPTNTSDQ